MNFEIAVLLGLAAVILFFPRLIWFHDEPGRKHARAGFASMSFF